MRNFMPRLVAVWGSLAASDYLLIAATAAPNL
jgi:hypothetical protein